MATISHKTLTGTQLHDVKGVAAASDNTVLFASSGASTFAKLTHANLQTTGNPFGAQLLHIRDEKAPGTSSQSLTALTWNTRVLQTIKTNEISASLASNQISLLAGTYYVIAYAAMNGSVASTGHQLRLRNITDSTTLVFGLNNYHGAVSGGLSFNSSQNAVVSGRFTISGTKLIELQSWPNANGQSGGQPLNSTENEVFADIQIWKLA